MATFIKIAKSDLLEMPNSERDKVDFLPAEIHQSFLQVNSIVFYEYQNLNI